jgi:hypothetical protein
MTKISRKLIGGSIRFTDDEWKAIRKFAKDNGDISLSDAIRIAVRCQICGFDPEDVFKAAEGMVRDALLVGSEERV